MKHWYRTSPSRVISAPPCDDENVTFTRVPSANGSRVSMNMPVSVMLRPMPLETPRSPSRKTGEALSNLPTETGLRGACTGCLSVRLDIGGERSLAGCVHGRCDTRCRQGKHRLPGAASHRGGNRLRFKYRGS